MFIDRLPRRQNGVSLIELIMFIVIVGVAVVGVLQILNLSTVMSADPLRRKQALLIAEGLLEEVQLAKFTFCDPTDATADTAQNVQGCTSASLVEAVGPEGSNTTRPYNNVNDYVTAFNTFQARFNNTAGVLVDAAGNPYGPGGYAVTLMINPRADLGPAGQQIPSDANTAANMNVLQISVRVVFGTGPNDTIVLDGFRSRYAPNSL